MLFVDTDNALGSSRGDVDDAYAITALVKSGIEIAAISSVGGNTSEPLAYENTERLCRMLQYRGPLLRASEARAVLHTFPGRIVALGPLTNVCTATAASEVMIVGAALHTLGRWPPLWPHEFNLTKDRAAAHKVFESKLPLTFFPLDVVRKLSVRKRDLDAIGDTLGEELRRKTERWYRHLRLVRGTGRFPIYDLAAALYAIDADGFTIEETTATMARNTLVRFGGAPSARRLMRRRPAATESETLSDQPAKTPALPSERTVRVCTQINAPLLWERFVALCRTAPAPRPH